MDLPELQEGRLVRRYKRFLADIELPGQGVVVCHCPNPGSMKNCAPEGGRVWVSTSDNPKRKLANTWELVEVDDALVCVNTMRANPVVREALEARRIVELAEHRSVKPEVKLPSGTRIDFGLDDRACYVEVKSVTLGVGGGVSAFPDSVTKRGTKHLRELLQLHREGARAVLLFCVGRTDTRLVRPADEIDPEYGKVLREVHQQGVEVLAYRADISTSAMTLGERLPVQL
jgi:sugar fermentation stimulation protein A